MLDGMKLRMNEKKKGKEAENATDSEKKVQLPHTRGREFATPNVKKDNPG